MSVPGGAARRSCTGGAGPWLYPRAGLSAAYFLLPGMPGVINPASGPSLRPPAGQEGRHVSRRRLIISLGPMLCQ